MFEITGTGTVLVSLVATILAAFASIKYGPRLVLDGRRAALGVLGRAGLVALAVLLGFVTIFLMLNRVSGTVSSYSEIGAFFYLLGFMD